MKVKTMFETSDGKLFEKKQNALEHDCGVATIRVITDELDEIWHTGIDVEDVAQHLHENLGRLMSAITETTTKIEREYAGVSDGFGG